MMTRSDSNLKLAMQNIKSLSSRHGPGTCTLNIFTDICVYMFLIGSAVCVFFLDKCIVGSEERLSYGEKKERKKEI